jgi:hypothetical protein
VPFAIRDGSTDRMYRSIRQNQEARVYYKGAIEYMAGADEWPKLKLLMQRFGSSHATPFIGPDPWNLRSTVRDAHLCAPGKLVISSDALRGDLSYWSVSIAVYGLGADWEPAIREFLALVRSQWPDARLNDGLGKALQQP